MTNKTQIFSSKETVPGAAAMAAITTKVNTFITDTKALGCMNFHVLPVVTLLATASPTTQVVYTVQINYYDPAVG